MFPREFGRYIEIFGGSGAVLLGKEPSKFEVYNDIEGELVNFFRVVKNRPAELLLELDLLPLNSREEFTSWLHFHDGSNEPNIHLADQLEIIDRTTPTSLMEEAEKLKTSLRKRSDYRDVRQAAAYLMRVRNSYFVANSNSAIIEQELFDQATELRKARRNPAVQGQARFLARNCVVTAVAAYLDQSRSEEYGTGFAGRMRNLSKRVLCSRFPRLKYLALSFGFTLS